MKKLKITPPEGREWVDLGLPSGTLWAKDNEGNYYTYDEAVETFQDSLPTIVDFAELVHYCKWTWDKERKGMIVTGQNKNSIFFPAVGYCDYDSRALNNVGPSGFYWSASPNPSNSRYAYFLNFDYGNVNPAYNFNRSYGYSVRCIKK